MKRLENKNHQWITGAVKSTPIPAIQLIVHQSPIEYELKRMILFNTKNWPFFHLAIGS